MEAKEFRIGNLILWKGIVVKQVDAAIISQAYIDPEGFNLNYKPISISDEWLIKLGYTSDEPISSEKAMFYRKGSHEIWRPFHRFLDELYMVEIKYVHQLQNLYFATQQEELDVK